MRMLIVDDEPLNVILLADILKEGGFKESRSITDSRLTWPIFHTYGPDIILLDLMMPYVDGFALLEQFRRDLDPDFFLPILVLTADNNLETRRRALELGATDFLTKPFDHVEVCLRVENLLRSRWQHLRLRNHNDHLDEKVRLRTAELELAQQLVLTGMERLEEAQSEILGRLAQAAEFRDDDTGQHTYRVGRSAANLARHLKLGAEQIDLIERAAPLHDVGKIGVSDSILLKAGHLTAKEFEAVKMHTTIGRDLLAGGNSNLVKMAESIALNHHENWDGNGYPNGRKGDGIPLEAQIVSCADVFDALTHERPYKHAWTVAAALEEINSQRGRQFSPRVVDAFLDLNGDGGA